MSVGIKQPLKEPTHRFFRAREDLRRETLLFGISARVVVSIFWHTEETEEVQPLLQSIEHEVLVITSTHKLTTHCPA
jgi:hypothetical protein